MIPFKIMKNDHRAAVIANIEEAKGIKSESAEEIKSAGLPAIHVLHAVEEGLSPPQLRTIIDPLRVLSESELIPAASGTSSKAV